MCFRTDTPAELQLVKDSALKAGASDAVICTHWAKGGEGALDLADAVIAATNKPNNFKLLYKDNLSIEEKINVIAKEMYGAGIINLTDKVTKFICMFVIFTLSNLRLCDNFIIFCSLQVYEKIANYEKLGYGKYPLCMAKTSNSLTGDPAIKGAPTGFALNISDIFVSTGAGFIVPMVGEVS